MARKRILILGSTGSIGRSAVQIAERAGAEMEIVGLAAGRNASELRRQLALFPGALFTMAGTEALDGLAGDPETAPRFRGAGDGALGDLIGECRPDLVLNALVGISGLEPTVAALDAGCDVALANKETLVTAGGLVTALAAERKAAIIPVDSEHFSLARCLHGYEADVDEIVLTASGGPFLGKSRDELGAVSIGDVLDHPTWRMGRKVTVDSATLVNKGLEVIEAHWLFGFPYDRISVVVHPQSIVHALVRLRDGSFIAHLAPPDMRLPILGAFRYPAIVDFPWKSLALDEIGRLEFLPVPKEYPAFELTLETARAGGTAPAVLNAADEVAVDAFLRGRIGFLEIVDWLEEALGAHRTAAVRKIEDVLAADRWTRDFLAARHAGAVTD